MEARQKETSRPEDLLLLRGEVEKDWVYLLSMPCPRLGASGGPCLTDRASCDE